MKRLPILCLALLIAVGCSAKHSVVGKWTNTQADQPAGATQTTTFTDGGKMSVVEDSQESIPNIGAYTVHIEVQGSYTVEGDSITLQADTVAVTENGLPAYQKAEFDQQLREMQRKIKLDVNGEGPMKMVWTDKDHFTATGASGKPDTYARASS